MKIDPVPQEKTAMVASQDKAQIPKPNIHNYLKSHVGEGRTGRKMDNG